MQSLVSNPNSLVANYLPDSSKAKIAVAMSGGVDSSVALYLLKKAGYEVVGLTAWLVAGAGRCCDNGVVDAVKVCDQLGVEHHAIDLREDFAQGIIKDFHESYARGETPIPCISCNNDIKWGSLMAYAISKLGATHIASGHYAKLAKVEDNFRLYKAKESKKDQSYMLWGLSQEQLSKTVFPLADLTKDEIRAIALEGNLCVADKPESQDICFVTNGMTNSDYLTRILGEKPGNIVEIETGEILGEHKGSFNYTYGQRKGLGIAYSEPLYVVEIDSKSNTVYVGTKEKLAGQKASGKNINMVNTSLGDSFDALVKIRYNSEPTLARVTLKGQNQSAESSKLKTQSSNTSAFKVHVDFLEPVTAITPGQAMVFYDKDGSGEVIGGAWIDSYDDASRSKS